MSDRFYSVWVIGAVVIVVVVLGGLSVLHGMALTTTGYNSPVPWGYLSGIALGLAMYWSALCWALGLSRSKPKMAILIAVTAIVLALGVPVVDKVVYARQQASIATKAVVTEPPSLEGKTALFLWPPHDTCINNCWDIVGNMQARVLVLPASAMADVDFGKPVDLMNLNLFELNKAANEMVLLEGAARPAQIDYVLIHEARAVDFGEAFQAFRPVAIPESGLHIDALIMPTKDGRRVDLSGGAPVLRLMHVSRTMSATPWLLWAGNKRYWNSADRKANEAIAGPFFCQSPDRDKNHWCRNAFRSY